MTARNRSAIAACTAVLIFTVGNIAFGQTVKPDELKVLDRYVGTWTHEATQLPSKSTPKKTTRRAIEQVEWMLGESFLEGRAVNETDGLKSLSFFTIN